MPSRDPGSMNPTDQPASDQRQCSIPVQQPDVSREGSGSSKRIANRLVALGSAAVLTVYTAGYLRTRSAAQRLEGAAAQRRTVLPVGPNASIPAAQPVGPVGTVAPASQSASTGPSGPPSNQTPTAIPVPSTRRGVAGTVPDGTGTPQPSATVSVAPDTAPQSAQPEAAVPSPLSAQAPIAAGEPAVLEGEDRTAETAAAAAVASQGQYRDGTYTGFGLSWHGDIEATVVVKGGRIVSATISRCLTRYPCWIIEALPPQVVSRQSAKVDLVSGATESTDAFYDAVVEALSKAK